MRKIAFLLFALLFSVTAFPQDIKSVCLKIDALNTDILNGSIKKQEAAMQFKQLLSALKSIAPKDDNPSWIFPLQEYSYRAIGGTNGNGYFDKGYHYLDGNKHAAHPAHDIFINDRNQDCIDDKTDQPVNVVAVADGIVIACCHEWAVNSTLRGGKYIWIYHPQQDVITYYAHNREIFVQPGDIVKQGQKIAEVGRTGFSAYKKRSPTHLHFSSFHLVNGLPMPYNGYIQLKNTSKS